jgi:hypothetical protein
VGLRDLFERLSGDGFPGRGERVTGPPPSGNGASSFHLTWEVPPVPLVEARATFELLEPPTAPKLYFWALQVSFQRGPSRMGGGHFGLQHHPSYDGGAVNWGGYSSGGSILDGSVSDLPAAVDINTRTYPWAPHRRYRYRVHRAPGQPEGEPSARWRGSITDEATGVETVVRDLWVDADHLTTPMVWSEVFADCDHPTVAVRWTDLTAVTAQGETFEARTVRLNYQAHAAGGCANTDTSTDGIGFVQRTNTPRLHPTGSRLTLP